MTENEKTEIEEPVFSGVIYSARSKTSGKYYVGQTTRGFKVRKYDHIYFSINKCHSSYNCHFHNAIRKYGETDFEWRIEAKITAKNKQSLKDGLDWYESFMIQSYDSKENGYNMTYGGGGALGWNQSDEAKKSISEKLKGRKLSEEQCKRIGDAHRGKIVSEETCRRISESNKGEKHWNYGGTLTQSQIEGLKRRMTGAGNPMYQKDFSVEHRKKISEAGKIEICQYNKFGVFIQDWDSAVDAAEHIGVDPTHISSCCSGSRKSACGFVWRHKGDDFDKYDSSNTTKPINQYSLDGVFVREWDNAMVAGRNLKIKRHNISKCCKGLREAAGGFRWEYKTEVDAVIE